jgi:hypothetical protein
MPNYYGLLQKLSPAFIINLGAKIEVVQAQPTGPSRPMADLAQFPRGHYMRPSCTLGTQK